MRPRNSLLVVVVGLTLVCMASLGAAADGRAQAASGALTRLLPPPDGQAYFGFTFRLWDSTDPLVGDSRPFDQRIQDSIQNELSGKKPTFLTVRAAWQDPNAAGKPMLPFSSASSDIAEVQGITGARSLLYLDWTLANTTAQNGGITTKDIASGALDGYIRQYAHDLKAYAGPVLIRLFGGEFNTEGWLSVPRTFPSPGSPTSFRQPRSPPSIRTSPPITPATPTSIGSVPTSTTTRRRVGSTRSTPSRSRTPSRSSFQSGVFASPEAR
jgi:hypothetical protein